MPRPVVCFRVASLVLMLLLSIAAGGAQAAPAFTTPASGTTLPDRTVTFSWNSGGETVDEWWVHVGRRIGGREHFDSGSLGGATSVIVSRLPSDGSTVHVRLWHRVTGGTWRRKDASWTAAGIATPIPDIVLPAAGTVVDSPESEFDWSWNGADVAAGWLYVGTGPGKADIFDSGNLGPSVKSLSVAGVPQDGSVVHARLWFRLTTGDEWQRIDRSWRTADSANLPTFTMSPGETFSSSTPSVEWSSNGSTVSAWWLYVGTATGRKDIFDSGSLSATQDSLTLRSLPNDGSTVHLRLWYRTGNSGWRRIDQSVVTRSSQPNIDDYELAFADEFDEVALDASKWYTGLLWGPYLPINNEQQLYIDTLGMHSGFDHSPFEMTGDTLKINATPTSADLQPPPRPPEGDPSYKRKHSTYRYNGPTVDPDTGVEDPGYDPDDVDYLSGIITSYDSFKMTHGYVETRAKLPAGQGLWPAFWLLPTHYVEDVPEIDVMEFLGHQVDRVYNTFHFFDVPAGWKLVSSPSFPVYATDWTQDFHTFGMRWSPRKITWYVDGVETHAITDQDTHRSGRKYKIPTQAMYLIANLAVGGNWPGDADETTPFPATYEIDYIRAYKKKTADPINLAADYQIMFNDEFDGSTLDPKKWKSHFLWGPYLPINGEDQYYVDALQSDAGSTYSPFSLSNGILSITARAANDPDGVMPPAASDLPEKDDPIWTDYRTFRRNTNYVQQDFTSGMLTSYESFKFAKGYAEVRARIPKGDGLWPAFWLLNGYYVSQQPEIDILEARGRRPDQIVHNYHRFNSDGMLESDEYISTRGTSEAGYADGFHTYGARWRPGRIDWYIDGILKHSYIGDDVGYQLMYVIVNLAVGGGFDPGATPVPEDFPAKFDIDYIRVYQEKD